MSAHTPWDGRSPLIAKDYVPDNPNISLVEWGTGYAELHGARHAREKLSHMFAAATDLLEACIQAEAAIAGLDFDGCPEALAVIRAAIAKAGVR